jgi:signal transduction histidine kinase
MSTTSAYVEARRPARLTRRAVARALAGLTAAAVLVVVGAAAPGWDISVAWAVGAAVAALALALGGDGRGALPLAVVAGSAAAVALTSSELTSAAASTAASAVPVAAAALTLTLPTGVLGGALRRATLAAIAAAAATAGAVGSATDTVPPPGVIAAAAAGCVAVCAPAVARRHRDGSTVVRQRIQLVAAAALTVAAAVAVELVARVLAHASLLPAWSLASAAALVPLALVAGRSPDARRRAGNALLAGAGAVALAVAVVAGELTAVLALGRVPAAREQSLVLAATVGTALAVMVFPPLLARTTSVARWAVQGTRRSPAEVLSTFAERASRGVELDELLLQLAESLRRTLGLERVELWVGDGSRLERSVAVPHQRTAAQALSGEDVQVLARAGVAGEGWITLWLPGLLDLLAPAPGAQVRVAPAIDDGRVLGLVVAHRAADDERFLDSDERALGEVARGLAVVLHNRQLGSALESTLADLQRTNAELVASRARLVSAADAERRRIERDIHDGAQQHLVALAVTLGLARDLLADDPAAVAELLDEMVVDVRETVAQVRDLAHGIYPALLKEAGLEEALRAAARRSPLQVSLDARDAGRHDADIEAAVYFCCLEALQNAAKHAPQAGVTLRAWRDAGLLHFEVSDDGPGYDPASVAAGHGLQNMADRVGAVGGAVRWESAPGAGTRVVGAVPVTAAHPTVAPETEAG